MRYLVRKNVINVLGVLWMPSVPAATHMEPSSYDVENMRGDDGKITRESVQRWLDCHAGDFSQVTDFWASIEDGDATVDIDWADEDNELTYNGCMFGDED